MPVVVSTAVTEWGGAISQSGSLHGGDAVAFSPRPLSLKPLTAVGFIVSAVGPTPGAPLNPFATTLSVPLLKVWGFGHVKLPPEGLHPTPGKLPKMISAFEELAAKASAATPSAIVRSVFRSMNPSPDRNSGDR